MFPSMFATFYLRRSQPLRYKIPTAKKAIVMAMKIKSFKRGSWNHQPLYLNTLRKG